MIDLPYPVEQASLLVIKKKYLMNKFFRLLRPDLSGLAMTGGKRSE
jgi:hypothetical protein